MLVWHDFPNYNIIVVFPVFCSHSMLVWHYFPSQILHRDISARNILVAEGFTIKISDFGFARDVSQTEYYRKMADVRTHTMHTLAVVCLFITHALTQTCDSACLLLQSWLCCFNPW